MRTTERFIVTGVVQGVGFRPFVWRTARLLDLSGEVRNRGDHVEVVATGPAAARNALAEALAAGPAHAAVEGVARRPDPRLFSGAFVIADSAAGPVRSGLVADLALCAACDAEMHDPAGRRAGYPLLCCTECGPRFSIVTGFPYDRRNTTMAGFMLCAACRAEYDDPADRRFHAEPIACPACGPTPRFIGTRTEDGTGGMATDAPLDRATALLRAGGILAVKGIGGYHLACLATDGRAVALLRARKNRPAKPLAVMARDAAMVRAVSGATEAELRLMEEPSAPVVTVAKGDGLAEGVAPGLDRLGMMLAYTPLHRLLLEGTGAPLVMTSGNRSGHPQVIADEAALADLAGLADGWLLHDRPIARRLDDSVRAVIAGRPVTLRRGRGMTPDPLALPPGFGDTAPVLALGGDMKAAFCFAQDGRALLSQHLGEMPDPGVEDAALEALADYRALFGLTPTRIAVDAHPDYASHRLGARIAAAEGLELCPVWHHHAHVAACMGEHGVPHDGGKVVGIALDGTGLGPDGTIWGGEILLCDYRSAHRVARLAPVALPGGDRAAREPWRMLLSHLDAAVGAEAVDRAISSGLLPALAEKPLSALRTAMRAGLNAPLCSSTGRLFDAMAAFLDQPADRRISEYQSYEGEAAMRLEALARRSREDLPLSPFAARETQSGAEDGRIEMDPAPFWRDALAAKRHGADPAALAARFHEALAEALAHAARRAAARAGTEIVALGGGTMNNALLVASLLRRLEGLRVLLPCRVPAGDGGLAFGQAMIASAVMEAG